MTTPSHRLEVRNTDGEVMLVLREEEAYLRMRSEALAAIGGQKSWRFELYEGGTLKATYKRGTWKEHGEGKT